MRFTCEHCGKRYVTNDVLQPGRIYRTKCKACGGLVTVRGSPSTADAAGEAPSPTPRPPPLSPPAGPRATPAPVAPSRPPPRPAVAAQEPRAAVPEPRYIDLFDGEGPAAVAASPAPPAPRPVPAATHRAASAARAAPARRTAPAHPPPEPDPLEAAVEVAPTPRPNALAVVKPGPLAMPPAPRVPPARRRLQYLVLGAIAAVGVIVLAVGAVWRPWIPSGTGAATSGAQPLPADPAPSPATTVTQAAPPPAVPAPPDPQPAAAAPAAAPAVDQQPAPAGTEQQQAAAKLEEERLRAERAEQERLARTERARSAKEEKAQLAAERAEKERLARAERARLKAERAEKDRLAREEKERLKAERAEKERSAREERERAQAEKVARAEPPPPPPGLSPDAIQTALASGRKGFEACFRDQARGLVPPIEATRATVRFLVQPGGTVTAPEIAEPELAALPAGQCLRSAAAALKFPAFRGEPARVEAPVAIPPGPPGGRFLAVEFTGAHSARGGGLVDETIYSEHSNDAVITDRAFAGGVVTYSGQVGMGQGSKYAGIGLSVNMLSGAKSIDASRFKSMTIHLAATGTKSLRIRIIGAEETTRYNGCYPVSLQRVSSDVAAYVLKFSDFDPETWCGAKGRSWKNTLPELVGFEIADATMDRQPVTFSVGSITLNP